jgi:outer membrane immunogenic protein
LSTDWLATFRGRVGLTFNDWLLYVTGGAAVTEQKLTNTDGGPLGGLVVGGSSSANSTKVGWTAGVGGEKLFGQWSIKAEYLFARFDGLSTTTTVTTVGLTNTQIVTVATDHLDAHIARVGFNYHFH